MNSLPRPFTEYIAQQVAKRAGKKSVIKHYINRQIKMGRGFPSGFLVTIDRSKLNIETDRAIEPKKYIVIATDEASIPKQMKSLKDFKTSTPCPN